MSDNVAMTIGYASDASSNADSEALIEKVIADFGGVDILVNNAGIGGSGPVLAPESIDLLHQQFETNAVGPLRMTQAFAPLLAAHSSSAVINVISVLSWATLPGVTGSYSASKAAAWALSNAMRHFVSVKFFCISKNNYQVFKSD